MTGRKRRIPLVYPSVLDAMNVGRVVYITNSAVISIGGMQLRQGFANNGGAIFVGSGVLTLTNSSVYSSSATNGGAGYNVGGNITLDSSQLYGNQAGNGGAFYHAAGTSMLQNNIIRDNRATNGGGIYNNGSNLTVRHNTVYSNSATSGGGFYTINTNPVLVNTILTTNTATTGHAVYGPSGYAPTYNDAYPAANAYGGGAAAGANSLAVNPLLVNPDLGDFHLQATSPVLDRGDPAMTLDHDFEGDYRPGDQGFDMGADEQASCRARIVRTGQIYGNVQTAVNNSQPGDTIQVSIGICRGVHQYVAGGSTYTQTVHITHELTLAGRYALDFSSVVDDAQAGPYAATASTFDAMNLGRTILITNSAAITLTRINLHNGNANLGGGSGGGAIYFNGPQARVEKAGFYSNTATSGGAIFNAGTNFVLYADGFFDNQATDGGAVFNATGVMTFTGDFNANNLFQRNNAANRGGGLYNDSGSVWILNSDTDQVMFPLANENQASQGGFAYNNSGQMILENNAFDGNQANEGGALYNNSGSLSLDRGNRLFLNEAVNSGGAIYNSSGSLTVWNSLIYGNTNTNQGAGIYSAGGNPQIIHNTFYRNEATNRGGSIYIAGGNPTIRANIFDRNTAPNGGSAVYAASGTLSYNDYWTDDASLQVAGGVSAGTNNVNVNPAFAGAGIASDTDFHLLPLSGLIDAGPASDSGVPHDFEDDIRPSNTYADIGADEYNACLAQLISGVPIMGLFMAVFKQPSTMPIPAIKSGWRKVSAKRTLRLIIISPSVVPGCPISAPRLILCWGRLPPLTG
ncbi:MAG: hypothetical protein HC875_00610 [Anaerolineales bacterium]|nr:hypothetical protein [Anaerolineales bacterium]